MSESTFELIAGSTLDIAADGSRKITRGIISNIDVTSDPDPEVLWRALAACSAGGYGLNQPLAGHNDLVNRRIVIRGYTTNGAIVDIMSESINYGSANPTALVISRRSYLSDRSANTFVDSSGVRRPNLVLPFSDPDSGEYIKADYATINYLHPMKSLSVSGLTLGQPPSNFDAVFGRVNNGAWQGLDAGYWLCTEASSDESRYTGYYSYRRTALSRVTIDWSEIAILFNNKTGKYVQIAESDATYLGSLPYSNSNLALATGGASKIGPFPTGDFSTGFGT